MRLEHFLQYVWASGKQAHFQAQWLVDPVTALREGIAERWAERVDLAELHGEGGERTLLVVVRR